MSGEMKRLALNCYSYFSVRWYPIQPKKQNSHSLKIPLTTIEWIEKVLKNGKEKHPREQNRFSKAWKSLIPKTFYVFYQNTIALTLGILLSELKEVSARTVRFLRTQNL